jgi:hypothetical protein
MSNGDRFQHLALVVGLAVCVSSPLSAQLAGMAAVRAGVPVAIGPFELNTSGSVDQIASPTRPRTAFSIETSLYAPIGAGGVWVGSALEGARDIDTIPVRPLLRLGVWRSFNALQVAVGASSHAARLGGSQRKWVSGDSTFGDSSRSRLALWSELEGRLSWRISRTTIAAVVGTRPDVRQYRPTVWGHLDVAYALNPYASLVGAAGTDAPRIALGIPAVRFASLALRVGAWPSSNPPVERPAAPFVVRAVGARQYAITFQAPEATMVELSGDFDGWKPRSFRQIRSGVWEATVDAAPGTYHVNLRVNGGRWFAPPGLPQTEDDFNGTVGILVLR